MSIIGELTADILIQNYENEIQRTPTVELHNSLAEHARYIARFNKDDEKLYREWKIREEYHNCEALVMLGKWNYPYAIPE